MGCVALAWLSGRLPFEVHFIYHPSFRITDRHFQANSNPESVDRILNASYVLPEDISTEIQDLVVKLLEPVSYETCFDLVALLNP